MISCNTTAVNTGKVNGVVVKIQNDTESRGFSKPQYLGRQHHILDHILRHVFDYFINCKSTTLDLDYKFVKEITDNYEYLQKIYTKLSLIPPQT